MFQLAITQGQQALGQLEEHTHKAAGWCWWAVAWVNQSAARNRQLALLDESIHALLKQANNNNNNADPELVREVARHCLRATREWVGGGLASMSRAHEAWLERANDSRSQFVDLIPLPRIWPTRRQCLQAAERINSYLSPYRKVLGVIEWIEYSQLRPRAPRATDSNAENFEKELEDANRTLQMAIQLVDHLESRSSVDADHPFVWESLGESEHSSTTPTALAADLRRVGLVLHRNFVPQAHDEKMQAVLVQPSRFLSLGLSGWVKVLLGGVAVFGIWRFANTYQSEIHSLVASSSNWLQEHLWEPGMNMIRELFMHENKEIVDANAIADARESLSRMINDYTTSRHTGQEFTAAQVEIMGQQLDMHVLTRSYEKEIQTPLRSLVGGDLVQLGLIQAQYIKHEMLVAMSAVDKILRENHFNTQLMAMAPAVLVLGFTRSAFWRVWYWAVDDSTSRATVKRRLRLLVNDIERHYLVKPESEFHFDPATSTSTSTSKSAVLALPSADVLHSAGELSLLLNRLETAVVAGREVFGSSSLTSHLLMRVQEMYPGHAHAWALKGSARRENVALLRHAHSAMRE